MKRRSEHLVLKRDGRTEFLRATKLARSIYCALHSVGIDEDWRAIEVANVVLHALRQKRGTNASDAVAVGRDAFAGDAVVLSTAEIADAVQHLLVVTGQPQAAVAYGAVAAERTRRRRSLATLGRFAPGLAAPATAPVGGMGEPPHSRAPGTE